MFAGSGKVPRDLAHGIRGDVGDLAAAAIRDEGQTLGWVGVDGGVKAPEDNGAIGRPTSVHTHSRELHVLRVGHMRPIFSTMDGILD